MKLARGFSRQHRIIHFTTIGSASGLRHMRCGFAYTSPYTLTPGQPSPGLDYLPASPLRLPTTRIGPALPFSYRSSLQFGRLVLLDSAWALFRGYGNINPLSIDYACRPRLRSRLTLGGLACPRNPWSFGGRVSHPSFATHACILTRVASTTGSLRRFTRHTTLPYPSTRLDPQGVELLRECHGFGGVLEPRYIVGAESLDQ